MIKYKGRRGKNLKKKNLGHIDLIFHVHVPESYVHMCVQYEVARRTAQTPLCRIMTKAHDT